MKNLTQGFDALVEKAYAADEPGVAALVAQGKLNLDDNIIISTTSPTAPKKQHNCHRDLRGISSFSLRPL